MSPEPLPCGLAKVHVSDQLCCSLEEKFPLGQLLLEALRLFSFQKQNLTDQAQSAGLEAHGDP